MTETYLENINNEYEYACEIAGQLHYFMKDLMYSVPLEDQQEDIAYMKECVTKVNKFLEKITKKVVL